MADSSMKDILKTLKVSFEQSNYKNGINSLLEKKAEIPADTFHFYLGNLYLKQGDLGAGRYNLEKAKKLGYDHQILENNIKFVEGKVAEYGNFRSEEISSKVVETAMGMPLQLDILIACVLVLVILICKKLKVITTHSIFIGLLILALIPLGFKTAALSGLREAVVLKDAKLYDGPSKVFSDIKDLPGGVKVLLGSESDGWFFIEYPRQLNGWILAEDIGIY